MKKCKTCNIEKPDTDFYAKRLSCKECINVKARSRWHTNPQIRERQNERRRKSKSPTYREQIRQSAIQFKQRYPEKAKARFAAQYLPQQEGFVKHHWSYNKEHYRDIIYLTQAQHQKIHKYMIYDQEQMMYRDLNGVLLNSKEAHLLNFKKYENLE